MRRTIITTAIFLICLAATAPAVTVNLGSEADTYVRDATARGSLTYMYIHDTFDYAGYLRFNMSSLGAINVSNARVIVTKATTGSGERNDTLNTSRFSLYGLKNVAGNTPQNWDEATLTKTGTNKVGAEWTGIPLTDFTRVVNFDATEVTGITESLAGSVMTVSGAPLTAFIQDRVYDNGLVTFIIGDDETAGRGYGIGTKEHATAATRPVLELTYTKYTTAYLPSPADKSKATLDLTTLSWRKPDPNTPGQTVTSDVYFGTTEPNALLPNYGLSKVATAITATSIAVPVTLTPTTTYYWVVDCTDTDLGLLKGPFWSFFVSGAPEITQQPAKQVKNPTESATFTCMFTTDAAISSGWPKWFKQGSPDTELLTSDPDNTITLDFNSGTGVYTSTLTIANIAAADDGMYYCQIKNANGTTDSADAKLLVRRQLAYWALDGDANDSISGLHGTLMGTPAFDPAGKIGQALIFDGTDDYVDLPDGFDDFTAGLSFTIWAKPSAVTNFGRFFDFGNGGPNDNIVLARNGTSTDLTYTVYKAAVPTYVTAVNVIALDEWQMFVVTMTDTGSTVIYKNGLPIQTGTSSIPNAVTRTLNYLGESNWAADAFYAGQMDDIRLYNYAISGTTVADMYSGINGPFCLTRPALDLDGNCIIGLGDLQTFSGLWLDCGFYPECP